MITAHSILKQMIDLEPIKTWSLIVTLLGDMPDPQLSGKDMGALLGQVGIRPEAVRVAVHRLKKDGWITTSKNGREVIYRLSASGIAATKSAYDDVYRTDTKYDNGWNLWLVESEDVLEEHGDQAIRLLKRVYLLPRCVGVTSESVFEFNIENRTIPAWMLKRLIPTDVIDLASKFNSITLSLLSDKAVLLSSSVQPIDVAAIRLLILHRWRKMALRENTWAHMSLFPEGAVAQCHRQVTALLTELPRLEARSKSFRTTT